MGELQSHAVLEEEFYEKIEAPKFVDFTKPDLSRPDDRYWFCSRVGCDQKHEEEMDHEAIYKDFVLRVMAARSPNVRLGKILNRNASGTTMKCPLTAPAKPSKSRLTRLAVISSFSHKIAEAKVKDSTPKPEVKQSSLLVKALTTPRNKNCPQNPNSFRSARNPKATSIAVPESRDVAKALVFFSPEKPKQKTTSSELTVSKITQGMMKQLQTTSQRKRVLGYSIKSSRDNECDSKRQLPTDASRRKFGTRKVKSRVYDSLRPQSRKAKEAKTSRSLKRKSQVEELQKKCNGSLLHDGAENDSSDMEIDEKLKDNSLSCTSENYEGKKAQDKKLSSPTAHSDAILPDTSQCHINSNPENNFSESQNLIEEGGIRRSIGGAGHAGVKTESSSISDADGRDSGKANLSSGTGKRGSEDEEKIKSSSRKKRISVDYPPENEFSQVGHQSVHKKSDEKENTSASDDKENDHEVAENDDKENASASEENRRLINNKSHCQRKLLGMQRTGGTMKKFTHQLDRTCKETSAAAGTKMVVKCKPKPTNPKPFRLRTDERGILKEANLERRLNGLAPVKESTATPKFPSQRWNDIDIQRSEKCPGQEARHRSKFTHGEGSEKEPEEITQNQPVKAARKNSKGQVEPRIGITPLGSDREDAPRGSSSRKMSSSLLQKKLVRPHGISSNSSKPIVSRMKTGQLSMIKETPSTISGHQNEARKPWERSVKSATKAPASRPSSRGRRPRPTTIPKEPNFHSIHHNKPKSCTRKLA